MKKFYLTLNVEMSVEVPIEAETLEEAINIANGDYFELPNLNDGNIYETYPKLLYDENYNLVQNFED